MDIKRLFFFLCLLAPVASKSQTDSLPIRLSVNDARDYAVNNNRSVLSAKLDVASARKKVKETVAVGLPQVSFAANYQHQFTVPELSFGSFLDPSLLPDGSLTRDDIINAYVPAPKVPLGVRNNTIFDFTLSQLIFSGEYIVGLQAFTVLQKVQEQALVKTEDQIRESVSGAYYSILVLDESERVLRESLKTTEQTLNELIGMNKEGFNDETDVDQIRISLANLQASVNTIVSQKAIAMKLLKFQLGIDFAQNVVLTDSLKGIIDQGNIQYLAETDFDLNNSIDYQIMTNQEKVSALMLRREKSKLLPVISGFYRHQEQTHTPAFNIVVKDVAGVSLTLPIITSGQRSAKISQAKIDLEKSRLNTANVGQNLIMEYESALSNYQTAYANYNTNLQAMELGRKVYDRSMIKYREGVSSSFELSQNQAQLLTAESNYYNSVLTLLSAKAKLDRILSVNNDKIMSKE